MFNDRITSAFWATKTNANTPDTYKAPEQGFLGACLAGRPYWYNSPSYPSDRHHFDISGLALGDDLPDVIILFGHRERQGLPQCDVLCSRYGIRGLLFITVICGSGSWSQVSPD